MTDEHGTPGGLDDCLADAAPAAEQQAELFGGTDLGLSPEAVRRLSEPPPRDAGGALPALPELEGEQLAALDAIEGFLTGGQGPVFSLHGLAGTGKTTVLAALARRRPDAWLAAPTGKAAAVLARKTGAQVTTLHRLLYVPVEGDDGRVRFEPFLEPGHYAGKLVLVDESSMINWRVAGDLLRTGALVVAVGDPGQLPPVKEAAAFTHADFELRQIRRQAADSPIIRQAHAVRAGQPYASDGEAFRVIDKREATKLLDWADAVLCWKNETRHRINGYMRRRRDIPPLAPPMPGEPVMCLENHPSGIMNGEVFTVRGYHPERGIKLDDGPTRWIDDLWFEWQHLDAKQPRRCAAFALGYAVTVHKSQGSEWPQVLVLDEFVGPDRRRWAYTAITRGADAVCIVPG